MIDIIWTSDALQDIRRLYDFLIAENEIAAERIVQKLVRAPERLRSLPRLGERVSELEALEIRRLIVDRYEIRYEIQVETIRILRIWHTRERRLI
jgi:plasmid stabilization system protein ParE